MSDAPGVAPLEEQVVLRALAEGTAGAGEGFFSSLAQHLARALGYRHALVAELTGRLRARALGCWRVDVPDSNPEWSLEGTPGGEVIRGAVCDHLAGVSSAFPAGAEFVGPGIESYAGAPLIARDGQPLGLLCAFDREPMQADPRRVLILRVFAARAAAELARLRVEKTLGESERRYRDLYEEAPIAYVLEDLESRFISANRAAMRILGVKPEEVIGTVGISLVPDTPDAQRRVKEAFASIGRGTDTSGVVLELRRKDDGRPIWIQWWSKPEPDGKYTRTMFVDITDRVLMEQEQARLKAQNLYLQEEIKSVHNFEEVVGRSPSLLRVLEKVDLVARTDSTVLITGETGTGKELIARALHSASRRRDKPLIKLNCAALPIGLVESELFGHEKGAFSGALQRRVGRFELANGGTIFLDEIGEMPLDVQVKVLRVLQEREFERVGGAETLKVDVRVIAATNRDLGKAVRGREFREDLFYRLNVFPVELPPLRDRKSDIPLLVRYFIDKYAVRVDRRIESVEADTIRRLAGYHWPGNVRELQNLIERALILSTTPELRIEPEIFAAATPPMAPATSAAKDLDTMQREHILEALHDASWVVEGDRGAARQLGLHPNTLRSRMKKLGIRRPAAGA
jgi:PAS domain S-box-containing protein